jgi:hypothetical protein
MEHTTRNPRYILLSPADFAALGVQQIAYVKPIMQEGALRFEIHAADGTPVAMLESLDVAMVAVRQHGLEPLRVH